MTRWKTRKRYGTRNEIGGNSNWYSFFWKIQVKQRRIGPDDICAICQDELLTEERHPVSYCRNGCGNSLHIRCMRVWADHQRKQKSMSELISCLLSRYFLFHSKFQCTWKNCQTNISAVCFSHLTCMNLSLFFKKPNLFRVLMGEIEKRTKNGDKYV